MVVSFVYPVAIFNVAFCMHSCSLLMLVEDARGDHMEEAYSRAGSHNFLMTLRYHNIGYHVYADDTQLCLI